MLRREPRCPHCFGFMRPNTGRTVVKVGQHTPKWVCRRRGCRYHARKGARGA